jgi:hypothetical protein
VAISYLLFERFGDPIVFHDTIPKFSRHLVAKRQMFKRESGAQIRNPFARLTSSSAKSVAVRNGPRINSF